MRRMFPTGDIALKSTSKEERAFSRETLGAADQESRRGGRLVPFFSFGEEGHVSQPRPSVRGGDHYALLDLRFLPMRIFRLAWGIAYVSVACSAFCAARLVR